MRVLHYGSPQKKMFMVQEIFYYFIFLDYIYSDDYGDSILKSELGSMDDFYTARPTQEL